MANLYAPYVFGLRDVKIKTYGGSTFYDIPAAAKFTVKPELVNVELRGDDAVAAVVSNVDSFTITLDSGGIDMPALATLMGKAIPVSSGVGPNRTGTLTISGGDSFGYVVLVGQLMGQGSPQPDIHAKFYKATITDIQYTSGDGEFMVASMTLKAIKDTNASDKIVDFIEHETAIAIA